MKIMFDNPMFEDWAMRALAHSVYGGADFRRVSHTAARITDGDMERWYRE